MGCPVFQQPRFEADDLMATLGAYARSKGLNVVHVAVDKDMLQCVADHGTHVLKPRTLEWVGVNEVTFDG